MTATSEAAGTSASAPSAPPPEAQPGLLDAALDWLQSLRQALARAIDITVLEARLAALNFTLIVIVAVASGLLLATAWIALFAAVVAWLHTLGLSWPLALLAIAAINLATAVAGAYAIYRMSNNLLFNALRKFITYGDADARTAHEHTEPKETDGERDGTAGSAAGNTPPAP